MIIIIAGSFGRMTFSDLDDGSYQLRVIARIEEQEMESEEEEEEVERGIASRSLTVSSGAACAVHFINAGVSISGRRAVVEFSSSGLPVSEFMCTHDNGAPKICECGVCESSLCFARIYALIVLITYCFSKVRVHLF